MIKTPAPRTSIGRFCPFTLRNGCSSVKGQNPLSNRACRFPAHGLPMVFVTEHARRDWRRGPTCTDERHRAGGLPRDAAADLAARLLPIARVEVVALCRRTNVRRGGWDRSWRPCPRAYPRFERDQSRAPSLRSRCSSRPSTVLRAPRTPAAQRSISPSAYTRRPAVTTAAQTGLSCSASYLAHVLRPLPRGDSTRVFVRNLARRAWPSPRRARLGSPVVTLTRRQASLHVAARALAPRRSALAARRAFDAPLGRRRLRRAAGACYPVLRCLPGRDLHPLVRRDPSESPLERRRSLAPQDAPRARA